MSKMFIKSQAAMEFLMTYGWAILVVLVAIGALAYFGVLSPDKFLPAKCQLPAGIACTDFKIDSSASTIDVVLRNGLGFDTTGVTVAVKDCTTSPSASLANGAQATFTATVCTLTGGSKFSSDVNVTYTNADTSLTHTIQGTITGRAE
jgi:hypothetical protein